MKALALFTKKNTPYTSSVGGIFTKLLSALCAFLSTVLIANNLETIDYGYFAIGFSIVLLLSIPIQAGIPNFVVRLVARYEVEERPEYSNGLYRRLLRFVNLYSIIIIFAFFANLVNLKSMASDELLKALKIGILIVPLLGYITVFTSFLRGCRYILLGEFLDLVLKSGLFLVFIVLGISIDRLNSARDILVCYLLSCIIVCVVCFIVTRRLTVDLRNQDYKFDSKRWFVELIPFTVNGSIQELKGRIVVFLIASISGPTFVAYYDVASKLAGFITFGMDAFNRVLSPFVALNYQKRDDSSLQHTSKNMSRVSFAMAMCVFMLLAFFGRIFLTKIYGSEFINSYSPLIVLCLGGLVSAFFGSVGMILSMSGYQRVFTFVNFLATIAVALLCIPAIRRYDSLGAACVLTLVLVAQNVYLNRVIKKKLNISAAII